MDILTITLPIYLVMAMGYLAVRFGAFKADWLPGLARFVVSFALPATLFLSLATQPVRDILNVTYLLTYGGAVLVALVVGITLARTVFRTGRSEAAYLGMGASACNSSFVGLAIFTLLAPHWAPVAWGMNLIVENLVLTPLVLVLAELGAGAAGPLPLLGQALRRTATNPLVIAILCGLLWSLTGLGLPALVSTTLTMLGNTTAGVGLFFAGGAVVGLEVRSVIGRALAVAAVKLVVMPSVAVGLLVVLARLGLPELDPGLRTIAVVSAGLPMFTILPIYASRHGFQRMAAGVLAFTTAASFVTLTAVIALVHVAGWA